MVSTVLLKRKFSMSAQQLAQARKDGLKLSDFKSGDRSLSHIDGFRQVLHAKLLGGFANSISFSSPVAVVIVNSIYDLIQREVPFWEKLDSLNRLPASFSGPYACFSSNYQGVAFADEDLEGVRIFNNVFDVAQELSGTGSKGLSHLGISIIINLLNEYYYYSQEFSKPDNAGDTSV